MHNRKFEYDCVQIFDDAIPRKLFQELLDVRWNIGWQFGWKTMSNPNMRYWHHEVGHGSKENTEDVSNKVFEHPLQIFSLYLDWLRVHIVPVGARVLRFYLNAHTYGTDGWPHTDTDRSDEVTTVLYLADEWRPEWGGETVLFDAQGNIENSVIPRPNRILSFPSDRLHAPRPLSRTYEDLRVVLVVKFSIPTREKFLETVCSDTEKKHINLLQRVGSGTVGHSGRSLLDHLIGTYRLLKLRNADPEVCLAGLFHSVYGTSEMRCILPIDREEVRDFIGERAERLVWLFCALSRPQCWVTTGDIFPLVSGVSIQVSPEDMTDLMVIERANLDEQGILDVNRRHGLK